MAVRIRMKKLGRRHRPFFRICAMDARTARDGRVIEELGFYDPMVRETDARAVLNGERIDYWLSVGAQPSDKVKVLIKKYGTEGTHLEQQKAALQRLEAKRATPPPPLAVDAAAAAAKDEAAPAVAEEAAEPAPSEETPPEAEEKSSE